jgi:broad specificity phosphatase PhoE
LDDRVMELSFGCWEGLTWREVKARDPSGFRARKAAKWSFVPPAGESYAMLADRVETWLGAMRRETLLVSHGGVARTLMHLIAGAEPNAVCEAEIDQGRVLVFEGTGFAWI